MWVTLTQRKAELKQQHTFYQLRNLEISREKRQMARQKMFETNRIQAEQRRAESPIKRDYYNSKAQYDEKIAQLKAYLSLANKIKAGNLNATPTDKGYILTGDDITAKNADIVSDGGQQIILYKHGDGSVDTNPNATLNKDYYDENGIALNETNYTLDDNGNATWVGGDDPDCNLTNNVKLPIYYPSEGATEEDKNTEIQKQFAPTPIPVTPDMVKSQEVDENGKGTITVNIAGVDPIEVENLSYAQTFTFDENKFSDITFQGLETITSETDLSNLENDIEDEIDDLEIEKEDATLEYQNDLNTIKSDFEAELQMLEQDSADEELILEQEQTQIETLMENVSSELQAVSDAISQQIQGSTIRLA